MTNAVMWYFVGVFMADLSTLLFARPKWYMVVTWAVAALAAWYYDRA